MDSRRGIKALHRDKEERSQVLAVGLTVLRRRHTKALCIKGLPLVPLGCSPTQASR